MINAIGIGVAIGIELDESGLHWETPTPIVTATLMASM
jgi:hypothetical protein